MKKCYVQICSLSLDTCIYSGTLQNSLRDEELDSSHCPKSLTQDNHLQLHLKVHSREKPCGCPKCSQVYSHESNLRHHLTVHTGERNFCCSVCLKSFAKNASLQVHLRVHTGEKPFGCTKCSKVYPWQPIYVDIWWFIQGRSLFAVLSVLSHLLWKLICKFIWEFTLEKSLWLYQVFKSIFPGSKFT